MTELTAHDELVSPVSTKPTSFYQEEDIDPDEWVDFKKTAGASMWERTQTAIKAGGLGMLEATLLESALINNDDTEIDPISNPMMTPKEIKDKFDGMEVSGSMSYIQAHAQNELNKVKEEVYGELGEQMSFDTPIKSAYSFLLMGGIASFSPSAMLIGAATGAAIGAVGGPIGALVGLGAGAAAGVGRGLYNTSKTIRAASIVGQRLARTKQAQTMAVSASEMAKIAARLAPPTKKALTLGAGNALEEVAIHYIEAEKGYHYDLGPAVTMGFFAPVMFKAAVGVLSPIARAVGKGIAKADAKTLKLGQRIGKPLREIGVELKHTTKEVGGVVKKTLLGEKPPPEKSLFDIDLEENAKIKEQVKQRIKILESKKTTDIKNAYEEIAEAVTTKDAESVLKAKLKDDYINSDIAIKEFETINELKKLVGDKEIDEVLSQTALGMMQSGYKARLTDIYPFLRSKKDLKNHLTELKKELGLPVNKEANWKGKSDIILTSKAGDLESFSTKNKIDNTKVPKRNLDTDTPAKNPTEESKNFMEKNEISNDPVEASIAKASKEYETAIDKMFKCLKGELDGDK